MKEWCSYCKEQYDFWLEDCPYCGGRKGHIERIIGGIALLIGFVLLCAALAS